jgi:flavin reductase (DIM6/NTAB) family NADH-FMN oxidoreductase RutF
MQERQVKMSANSNRIKLKISPDYLAPLPSVLVSCRGLEPPYDKDNIIAIARVATLTTSPVLVCISVKDERFSYHQIKQSEEFVINLVVRKLCWVSDWCGMKSGRDYDKFKECSLDAIPIAGLKIAPAIAQSPFSLGCKLVETVERAHYAIFIGEVVSVEANPEFLDDKSRLDFAKTGLVGFSGPDHNYYDLGERLGFYGYSVASEEVLKNRLSGSKAKS